MNRWHGCKFVKMFVVVVVVVVVPIVVDVQRCGERVFLTCGGCFWVVLGLVRAGQNWAQVGPPLPGPNRH